ncbi:MAG: hypothetical protein HC896_00935 [Bacteroidales bacterium]|nr:hypothetical protein [Bacteroidales bacterium]
MLEPGSLAIVHAADQMPRNGDQFFPYRQQSDFFYLTGVKQEKSALILYKPSGSVTCESFLFILKPNPHLETWEGRKLTLAEASEISGIKEVATLDAYQDRLMELMAECPVVYINLFEHLRARPEVKNRDTRFYQLLKDQCPLHNYLRLAPLMQQVRVQKEPEEIAIIKQACNITQNAFHGICWARQSMVCSSIRWRQSLPTRF